LTFPSDPPVAMYYYLTGLETIELIWQSWIIVLPILLGLE